MGGLTNFNQGLIVSGGGQAVGAYAWVSSDSQGHATDITPIAGAIPYYDQTSRAALSAGFVFDGVSLQVLTSAVGGAVSDPITFNQRWNNAAVAFTGLLYNAVNTASGPGSRLMSLQVGGVEKMGVDPTGNVFVADGGGLLAETGSATGVLIGINGGDTIKANNSGFVPTVDGVLTLGATFFHWSGVFANNYTLNSNGPILTTQINLTNNAGASAGTLTNAPSIGNPTKWIPINDNGTIRNIPCW
jgi:hypothetical protein